MPDPDLYKILQVDPEADPEIIQAAYRRLAQKFHPDLAAGREAADRMVLINLAWATLRDPVARAAYDQARLSPPHTPGTMRRATVVNPPAGPPPGDPSGSVLRFGRYDGWSLGEIARTDVDYLEWLDRMPIGRPYRDEIDPILRRSGRRRAASVEAEERHGLFRRR